MSPIDPADIGGQPAVMPTNSGWFSGVLKSVADTTSSVAKSVISVQEEARRLASTGVPSANRPPGTFGLNPQASSVPGGTPEGAGFNFFGTALSPGLVLAGLAILALVLLKAKS